MELKFTLKRSLYLLISILLLAGFNYSCSSSKDDLSSRERGIEKPETETMPSAGGTLEFDNGVKMSFPPGAVPADTPITIELLDDSEVFDMLEKGDFPLQPLVVLKVDSEAQELNEPVLVTLPISSTNGNIGWPVPVILDLETGAVEYLESDTLYDPTAQMVEFSADHFSGLGAGTRPDNGDKKKCNDPLGECRCGRIYVKSSFHDYSIGDCQTISDEVSVQFLDCPGQPTEKHKLSEITGDCIAMGSLSFHGSVYFDRGEMRMNCSDAIPFVIGGNNTILGGGPMQCTVNENLEGMFIDILVDEQISLTGEFDGTNLNFNPPEAENITGYLKAWAIVEGEKITAVDITFDDETATGDVLEFQGFTLFSFTTSTEDNDFDRSQFAFSIPLDTSGEAQITIQEEEAVVIMTISMELSY